MDAIESESHGLHEVKDHFVGTTQGEKIQKGRCKIFNLLSM